MAKSANLSIIHKHAHVEWKIENFFDLPKEDCYYIKSPNFSMSNSQWCLWLYPNGEAHNNSANCIGLYLTKDFSYEECCVTFKVGIKRKDGSKFATRCTKYIFRTGSYGFGCPNLIFRPYLHSSKDILAVDGSLTVFCSARIENNKEAQTQTSSPYVLPSLADDLKRMYLDRENADITIKVKNREFVVHKSILTARSKVFAAMFGHNMAENRSGVVEVDDSDPDSFEDFILYLYTGKLDVVSSNNVFHLYKIADKYGAEELKKECALCMTRELSVNSFCDIVQLATMHDESDILTSAMTFFMENLESILKSPEWHAFFSENTVFAKEVLSLAFDWQQRTTTTNS